MTPLLSNISGAMTKNVVNSDSALVRRSGSMVAFARALAGLLGMTLTAGAVTVEFVRVGDAGNAADTNPVGYGAVGYEYSIARFEWTNAQYVQFLNAVDPEGLNPNAIYNSTMGSDVRGGISFNSGSASGSKYASRTNMANKPVNFVSWFDGARVANWLNAGGLTYASTTSGSTAINSGAYTLGGAVSGSAPARNNNSNYWIPTRDEWYKAAYYKGGGTTAGYWDYATQTDTTPSSVTANATGDGSAGSSGNYENYNRGADWPAGQDGNVTTIGTNGGASAYGTFDQGGNVEEWNDLTGAADANRGIGGGSWATPAYYISSTNNYPKAPANEYYDVGFRVAGGSPSSLTWNTTSGTWSAGAFNWSDGRIGVYASTTGLGVTFSNSSGGTVTLSGTMQPSAVAVSASSGTYTFSTSAGNLISGSAALSKSGAGILVLSGSNAYSGGTTLSAGTLRLGHDGALGAGTLTLAGGTLASSDAVSHTLPNPLSVSADTTFGDVGSGSLTFSGTMDLGGSTRTLTSLSNVTISGVITNGGLTKSGTRTLTLTGSNTYSGATTISAGTLQIGSGGTTGSIVGNVTNNAVLAFNRSDALTYSGTITGTGSLTQSGAGTLTLTGSNTYSGATTISSGTLQIGSGGTTGSIAGDVSIASAARLAFNRSDALTWSGTASGAGGLVKLGSGTLTLSGSHGYTGPTTVQAGTLALNGTIASSAVSVASGATLKGNAFIGSSLTVSGTLSPGNSPGTVTAGSLTLQPGSTTLMKIVGVTSGTSSLPGSAGTDYDTIVVTGSSGPAYGGALSIVFSSTNPFADGTAFDLFQFTGTTSGSFASIATVGSGLYANLSLSRNADGTWYSGDTSGHQFLRFNPLTGDLVVVPEPSTWSAAVIGAGTALAMARRRRRPRRSSAAGADA